MAKKKIHHVNQSRPKEAASTQGQIAKIKVVGIGGGGGHVISRMRDDIEIRGIDFIAINTDSQDLDYTNARQKIYIGKNLTHGLGTGMNPELGRQAAEESRAEIAEALKGADIVFLTACGGGGTGSGAAPFVAEVARETGALTVAIFTKPFSFEGGQRMRIAQEALVKLKEKVDTLIVVPNDRIFSVIKKDTPIIRAFEHIDNVLKDAVQGIAELIAMPGIINIDFADVRVIMRDAGFALVGTSIASGQERAVQAVNHILNSPLTEIAIDGAKNVLFGVFGGKDLRMTEVNDAAKVIAEGVDPAARIIFGAYHDRRLKQGQIKITLIATGFNGGHVFKAVEPMSASLFSSSPGERDEASRPASAGKERASEREHAHEGKEPERKSEKKESGDVWDIPAFLRKKKP